MEAETQLALDAILPTRMVMPDPGTVVGAMVDLIPAPPARLPLPRKPAGSASADDLGAQIAAICERAERGPEVTGTYQGLESIESPRAVLATFEPWPLPPAVTAAGPLPRPAPLPIPRAAPSSGRRVELILLYTTVSLATFLGTVAALY